MQTISTKSRIVASWNGLLKAIREGLKGRILWVIALLLVLWTVAWTHRYIPLSGGEGGLVLYDTWDDKVLWADGAWAPTRLF